MKSKEKNKEQEDLRKTGISIISQAPWGTHICQFYQTKEDLIDILVPYFKAGLENNELCTWITSEPLKAEEAKAAMKKAIKSLDDYIRKGQMEILDYSQWYTKSGQFEADKVLQAGIEKENKAIERGFDGLRISGNTFWLERTDWRTFTEYEATVNTFIGTHRILTVCTYSLDKCGAVEMIDVAANHPFALIRKEGEWHIIESSERRKAEGELGESRKTLKEQARKLEASLKEALKSREILVSMLEDNNEIRENLEKSKSSLTEAQRIAHLGNWDWDIEHNQLFWSDETYRIFGLEPHQFRPTYEAFLNSVHPDDGEFVKKAVNGALRNEQPYNIDHRIVLPDSTERVVHEQAEVSYDEKGNPLRMVGTVHDITERKQMEVEVKEYSERLEQMVEERTKELRNAQEELVAREKLAVLGKLAGGMAHELRNPLGAIKNAGYFLNMALEKPEADVKEILEVLTREVGASERIISSLLDFARPKLPTRQKMNINDVIQEALSRVAIPENAQVVRELKQSLPAILADPDQLRSVFGNIILNGIQAMPEGGELLLRSQISESEWLAVSFTDTGVGISREDCEKLFEPLFTTKAKGIGLGLALSQSLVEKHGGSIEVESEVGKGSTFTVKLPIANGDKK